LVWGESSAPVYDTSGIRLLPLIDDLLRISLPRFPNRKTEL
jgi:hypothetical protein